jgi:histidyl-tRNA synthetase
MISTKPAAGTRDYLPAEMARRHYATERIRAVYEGHCFQPIDTPVMERLEVLTGKYGDEGEQLIFRVLKRAQKLDEALGAAVQRAAATGDPPDPRDLADLALRYDLTVPLSRFVAANQNELPRIFKRYHIGPVWRADRPAKGRFREFVQCDVDVVGSESALVEADVLSAAAEALEALGIADYTFQLNDRRLLAALTAAAGVPAERSVSALVSLDKLDKVSEDQVREEMERNGIPAPAVAALFGLVAAGAEGVAALATRLGEAAPAAAVAGLEELMGWLRAAGVPGERVAFAPALARGLGYYTGPIYEITLPGYGGSIGAGGRYDDLVGMFLGRPLPACGVSLGFERLLLIMNERGLFPASLSGHCDVYVTQFPGVAPAAPLGLATALRRAGLRVDLSPEVGKLKRQFQLAEQMSARVVTVIGPDEAAAGAVVLKRMATGEQVTVSAADAADTVRTWLGTGPS